MMNVLGMYAAEAMLIRSLAPRNTPVGLRPCISRSHRHVRFRYEEKLQSREGHRWAGCCRKRPWKSLLFKFFSLERYACAPVGQECICPVGLSV